MILKKLYGIVGLFAVLSSSSWAMMGMQPQMQQMQGMPAMKEMGPITVVPQEQKGDIQVMPSNGVFPQINSIGLNLFENLFISLGTALNNPMVKAQLLKGCQFMDRRTGQPFMPSQDFREIRIVPASMKFKMVMPRGMARGRVSAEMLGPNTDDELKTITLNEIMQKRNWYERPLPPRYVGIYFVREMMSSYIMR